MDNVFGLLFHHRGRLAEFKKSGRRSDPSIRWDSLENVLDCWESDLQGIRIATLSLLTGLAVGRAWVRVGFGLSTQHKSHVQTNEISYRIPNKCNNKFTAVEGDKFVCFPGRPLPNVLLRALGSTLRMGNKFVTHFSTGIRASTT